MKDPATPADLAPLPGENENDPLVCIEADDGCLEWVSIKQLSEAQQRLSALAADVHSHKVPSSLYVEDHPAFETLDITPQIFRERFNRYCKQHYDYPAACGKSNPYTGSRVCNETDYLQYLREHFFYQLCSYRLEKSLHIVKKEEAAILKLQDHVERESCILSRQISCVSDLEAQKKALQEENDELCLRSNTAEFARDSLRCELDGMKKKFSPRNLFARSFALLLCVAFFTGIICFNSGKKSGYDSGYQDGNEEGLTAGYDSGYDEGEIAGERQGLSRGRSEGYRDGYSDGQRVAAVPSIRSGTGTGSSRQSAIAPGYIGNASTGKFHLSSCSYLPNQENQVVLSSYDAAIAAGYTPCNYCLK